MTETETISIPSGEPATWLPARESGTITAAQYEYLMNPLRSARIATRQQGGKTLSYLESWEVRAHLIRIFGFGNFDVEVIDNELVFVRDYENNGAKQEIAYKATVRLTVRDERGRQIACYQEAAVGSASGGNGFGDMHDNALKTAASDALKRCAINLGTQFGLSLYDDGSRMDVVRKTLVLPAGMEVASADPTPEQMENLASTLGATPVEASA